MSQCCLSCCLPSGTNFLFLEQSSCVSAWTVALPGGCFPIPWWVGHSFLIHSVVVYNSAPADSGLKRLAINEVPLLVESWLKGIPPGCWADGWDVKRYSVFLKTLSSLLLFAFQSFNKAFLLRHAHTHSIIQSDKKQNIFSPEEPE